MHTLAETVGRPNPKPHDTLDSPDIVKALLAHGAKPNARLATPIMDRVHNDANSDAALGDGATPLMRAAKQADVAVMRDAAGPRRRSEPRDQERNDRADVRGESCGRIPRRRRARVGAGRRRTRLPSASSGARRSTRSTTPARRRCTWRSRRVRTASSSCWPKRAPTCSRRTSGDERRWTSRLASAAGGRGRGAQNAGIAAGGDGQRPHPLRLPRPTPARSRSCGS